MQDRRPAIRIYRRQVFTRKVTRGMLRRQFLEDKLRLHALRGFLLAMPPRYKISRSACMYLQRRILLPMREQTQLVGYINQLYYVNWHHV